MIELHKKRIWNDEKTVNVMADACLHHNPKIVIAACKFFLFLQYDDDYEDKDSDESSDEEDAR